MNVGSWARNCGTRKDLSRFKKSFNLRTFSITIAFLIALSLSKTVTREGTSQTHVEKIPSRVVQSEGGRIVKETEEGSIGTNVDVEIRFDIHTPRNGLRGTSVESQRRPGTCVHYEGHGSRGGSVNGVDADINSGLDLDPELCLGCKGRVDGKRQG